MPLEIEYTKTKSRRGYETVKALDPHDGGEWDLLVSHLTMDRTVKRGRGAVNELAHTVRTAILRPAAIFQGVRDLEREISEDRWLCYVTRPNFAYNLKTGEKVIPAWDDEVFLVFVNDERVYYMSYWCKCDPIDTHLPFGHEDRFRERVWPQ